MDTSKVALLSVPQVSEKLGVTRSCVRRWIHVRKIATVKLGRLVRVPSTELDRLVDAGLRPARGRGDE
jgi:excisionase family DNA binding protein